MSCYHHQIVELCSDTRWSLPANLSNNSEIEAQRRCVAKQRVAVRTDGSGHRAAKLVEHVIAQHCQRPGKDAVDVFHYS
jgi:hypothetical protein